MTEPRPGAPSTANEGQPYALAGRIGPDHADALSDCVCARVAAGEEGTLACDVGGVEDPDLGTVGALARMALTAQRLGRHIELTRARPELRELLELAGLGGLAVDASRMTDERVDASDRLGRDDRR